MLRTAHWTVEVFLDTDDEGSTYAEAFLLSGDDEPLFTCGSAVSTPADPPDSRGAVRRVAARALSELADALTDAGPVASGPGLPAPDGLAG